MYNYIKIPENIETISFEIIENELGDKKKKFSSEEFPIVQRVIHTTGDFNYSDLIEFKNNPVERGLEALKKGGKIYCDTNMIVNGLNSKAMKAFSLTPYSLVSDETIGHLAKQEGVTRSIKGIEKGAIEDGAKIFLIGNAPTALFRLKELIDKGEISKPELIIGVPVGFVGAEESKEIFLDSDIPYITVKGRKGGSPVAVSILHGMLYQIYSR